MSMRAVTLLLTTVLTSCLALGLWWAGTRPVPVEGSLAGPLASVSFSPYRTGQSPLTGVYPSEAELAADLALLAPLTRGIRTYTSLEGFERIPRLAARHGLLVTMGAWLGTDPIHNRKEIEGLIRTAEANPQTVSRVIVGNETLVRHEITVDTLIEHLREVRSRVRQPVSYADVPEVWLYYPQLADAVDFITVHILPYWEDKGVAFEDAERYLLDNLNEIRRQFPGKPLLVGESGWPEAGRPRGPAVPERSAQAGYLRMLVRLAAEHGFDYNVIEAFDQEWKGALEGLTGAHWGIMDQQRRIKYPGTGPVEPMPQWPRLAFLAIACGAFSSLAVGLMWQTIPPGSLAALAAAAQTLAALNVLASLRLLASVFSPLQQLWSWLAISGATTLSLLTLAICGRLLAARPHSTSWPALLLHQAHRVFFLGLLALIMVHSLQLAWDGHLVDVPVLLPAVPASCLLLLVLCHHLRGRSWQEALANCSPLAANVAQQNPAPRQRSAALLLSLLLLLTALAVFLAEAFEAVAKDFGRDQGSLDSLITALSWAGANWHVNIWVALLVLFALPCAVSAYTDANRQSGRTSRWQDWQPSPDCSAKPQI